MNSYPKVRGTRIEIVSPPPRGRIRHAVIDFDGTISLIRDGWQNIMVPMMIEILSRCPRAESPEEIEGTVKHYVDHLTGKQTIYQMIRLGEEVEKRGGKRLDPLEYKRIYHDQLQPLARRRMAALEGGDAAPEDLMLAGSRAFLEGLRARGVTLYLASGTDVEFVEAEARALGIADRFDGGIFGALPNYKDYSKEMVIRRIIGEFDLRGPELLIAGDGYVEIENARQVGAVALGVVSRENNRYDMNAHKRERLIRAGAHLLVPDLGESAAIIEYLWSERS